MSKDNYRIGEDHWITADGRIIRVNKLSEEHLFNAGKMFIQRFYVVFKEMKKRNMILKMEEINKVVEKEYKKYEANGIYYKDSSKEKTIKNTIQFPLDILD